MKNQYYKILELDPAKVSSSDIIIKAFRKLAMKYHPDRGGSEAKFKELKKAYDWLLDHFDDDEEIEEEVIIYKSSFSDGYKKPDQPTKKQTWSNWRDTIWDQKENDSTLFDKLKPKPTVKTESKQAPTHNRNELALSLKDFIIGGVFTLNLNGYETTKVIVPPGTVPGTKLAITIKTLSKYSVGKYENIVVLLVLGTTGDFSVEDDRIIYKKHISFKDVLNRVPFFIPDLTSSTSIIKVDIPDKISSLDPIIIPNKGFKNNHIYVYLIFDIPNESI